MVIDAIVFAHFAMLFAFAFCWGLGRIHRFEQEIAWSRRKE